MTSIHSRSIQRGTTLLELLVVIAILSLVATLLPLALQRMLPARRLATAARALAIDIRNLQSRAEVSGQTLQLTLEPSGYSLQSDYGSPVTRIQVRENIHIVLKQDGSGSNTTYLKLYPDGSSSGGVFELRTDRLAATVQVSSLTGHVHVSQ